MKRRQYAGLSILVAVALLIVYVQVGRSNGDDTERTTSR